MGTAISIMTFENIGLLLSEPRFQSQNAAFQH